MGKTRDAERNALRERWVGGDRQALRLLALERLQRGYGLEARDFGMHEGRIDLRGLPGDASPPERGPGPAIVTIGAPPDRPRRRTRWSDLDLSFAELPELRWFDLDVERCRFEYATLQGLRCWGISVRDCSFVGADLRNSQWGPNQPEFRRSIWTGVDFRRADLRWSACYGDLEHIDVTGAKFTQASWNWSNLRDVTFGGVVHGLEIGRLPVDQQPGDWRLEGVDIRKAKPRNVVLHGVNLGVVDVRLPSDDRHWVIPDWPGYLDRVAAAAHATEPGVLRDVAQIWVDYSRRDRGPNQTVGFVAVYDIAELGGNELVGLLSSARRLHVQTKG